MRKSRFLLATTCMLTLALTAFAGCSDDDGADGSADPDAGENCPEGMVFDPISVQCVEDDTADASSDVDETDAEDDTGTPDVRPDTPTIPPECDMDQDGSAAESCGGFDCDDNNSRVSDQAAEICDELDNNCDGQINNNIECTFFAHTFDMLYRIDPFQKSAVPVTTVPTLFDIDTHPDGTLWGVNAERLYRFNDIRDEWELQGSFPEFEQATGLAIDSQGQAYVTAGDGVYLLDLATSEATLLGTVGGGFYSSGDCVVNKSDTLYMTSKDFDVNDTLVVIDTNDGSASAVGELEALGYAGVYGLTAGWGHLYGLTKTGELIDIDPTTGTGTLVHHFDDKVWFGAASSPGR